MSAVKVSTVPEFPGSITLPDRLTMAQVNLIDQSFIEDDKASREGRGNVTVLVDDPEHPGQKIDLVSRLYSVGDQICLKALLAIVEIWSIQDCPANPTLETFPGSPRQASHNLIRWAWNELVKIYNGAMEIPNA